MNQNPNLRPATTISDDELFAARDAMQVVWDYAMANENGGVSWLYLAQVALESARQVRISRGLTALFSSEVTTRLQ